jgi:hypothetical protein
MFESRFLRPVYAGGQMTDGHNRPRVPSLFRKSAKYDISRLIGRRGGHLSLGMKLHTPANTRLTRAVEQLDDALANSGAGTVTRIGAALGADGLGFP